MAKNGRYTRTSVTTFHLFLPFYKTMCVHVVTQFPKVTPNSSTGAYQCREERLGTVAIHAAGGRGRLGRDHPPSRLATVNLKDALVAWEQDLLLNVS